MMAKKFNLLDFKLNEFSQQVFTRLLLGYDTSPESHGHEKQTVIISPLYARSLSTAFCHGFHCKLIVGWLK